MTLIDKKTRTRLEGVAGLGKTIIEKNPVAHAILTAKEVGESAYKIRYGKDPRYVSRYKQYLATPKPRVQRRREGDVVRVFEEDPLKRMLRQTRDPRMRAVLRRLLA